MSISPRAEVKQHKLKLVGSEKDDEDESIPNPRWKCRLNKNFISKGHLPMVMKEHNLTGLGLSLLIKLLSKAQFNNNPRLEFKSWYELLNFLGWPDSPQYYEKVKTSLRAWKKVSFQFDEWYRSARTRSREKDDWGRQKRDAKRRKKAKRLLAPKSISHVLKVKKKKDGRIVVIFSDEFFNANCKKAGYYLLADPAVVNRLRRNLPEILLYMYLLAITWQNIGLSKLMKKIGLKCSSDSADEQRISKAIGQINDAITHPKDELDVKYKFEEGTSGKTNFRFTRADKYKPLNLTDEPMSYEEMEDRRDRFNELIGSA